MALASGFRLGPYEIVAPLGAGGMGEVYRARDTRLDRTVAIKVLSSQVASTPELRERFEREARVVSQLSHPHICSLFDVGEQDGTAFLVMEYLEGQTLADRLEQGALPPAETLRLAIEVGSALDAAHRQGIVHRDLKPGNVMLTKTGAKLLDFGLAKIGGPGGALSGLSMMPTTPPTLTAQGMIVGTFQYMSPEQLDGKEADARTDIFAFGALLHEMASGRKAFQGATQISLIGAILRDTPPALSSIVAMTPPALDFVIRKCLAKSPDDRWQTARDIVSQLEWIAQGGSQPGASAIAAAPSARRSRAREGALLAAALVFAAAAGVLAWLHFGRAPVPARMTRFQFSPPADSPFVGGAAAPFQAVSPDGSRIAFMVAKNPLSMIAVRTLDTVPIQVLPGTEDGGFPFWSTDSRFIGFFAGGKLKKIEVTGGPAQSLCDAAAGEGGTWNSDGTIVFAPGPNTGLFRVSAAGGSPTPVTTLDASAKETSHRWPWFLPDGKHFLYIAGPPGMTYVGSLDSKDRVKLFGTESKVLYANGHVLFARQGTLLAQPFDAARLRLSSDPFPVAENIGMNPSNGRAAFGVSENGVLSIRNAGSAAFVTAQLAVLDRNGKTLRDIGQAAQFAGIDATPDGLRVAAHNHVDPGGGDIWVLDAERGTNLRFTFDVNQHYVQPVWSPDGSRIAYAASGSKRAILQKASSGAGQEETLVEVKATGNFYVTHWSRDGKYILYVLPDPDTKKDIWALPMTGDRKPFPVLKTTFNEDLASLSPDGQWIAYQSDESGRFEIYVQPFPPTGGKWQISTAGGGQARWNPDGRELFFLGPDRKLMAVDVKVEGVSIRPGVPTALFDSRAAVTGAGTGTIWYPYAVARNGQQFVVETTVREIEQSPLTVIMNWPTLAARR